MLSKRKLHELEQGVAKPKGKWSVSNKPLGPTAAAQAEGAPAMTAASVGDVSALTRRLLELLFECWAECGPAKAVGGGASPDLEGLQVLSGILSAAVALLGRLQQQQGEGGEGPSLPLQRSAFVRAVTMS